MAMTSRAPEFKDRLVFDVERGEVRDGPVRYLLIRQDSLTGMFRKLPAPARRAALAALGQSIEECGGDSVDRYIEANAVARLMEVVANTAAQLGWGSWRFDESRAGELGLEVENSPFAGTPVDDDAPGSACAPISGMLGALGARILGGPVLVDEIVCATGGGARCRFRARLAPVSRSRGEQKPRSAAKRRHLQRGV